jgi:NAD(P)-dependent dehydrogenase (short-subunit alcohol dehydrogenase family)
MLLTGDSNETWVLLGASRGLGLAFARRALTESVPPVLHCFSRKAPEQSGFSGIHTSDFSKNENWGEVIGRIRNLEPERIFYFAAGGPHGKFQSKDWKDHVWSWKVSFEFPAFLCHQVLRDPQKVRQIVFVGSSVAESHPDPMASSYSAAKHALLGLLTSIQAEGPTVDLRLFSPGYMDTQLLPANAWPRQRSGGVKSPEEVAEILWTWIHNADDGEKHFVLKS